MLVPTVRTFTDPPDPTSILTYAEWNATLYDTVNLVLNPPMVHVRQAVTQSIPNSTWTPLTFDTEIIDTEGIHSTATTPSRITPKTPGWYMGWFGGSWVNNTAGTRAVSPRKNGNMAVSYGRMDWRPVAGGTVLKGLRFWMPFNGTTDYVEVIAWQSSGGALNTWATGDEVYPEMFLRWWRTL